MNEINFGFDWTLPVCQCSRANSLWLPNTDPEEQRLSQYKLSWVFFNSDEPDLRILMDNHKPIGLHVHVHNGPQIPVSAATIEEAQNVFVQKIKEHFDFDLEV